MTKITRQLAAIMFSDIAGYSALMQENEQKAKTFRDKYKSETDLAVNFHQGKVLQYYGDGSLSMFQSAIEAVKCAVKIQLKMTDEPKVNLRIGLHMGDILFDDDGVYGDSINVASRIESLSIPGAVLISEKVYDEIKNHPDLPSVSIGSFELKNIKKAIEVHAINIDRLIIPKSEDIKGKLKENAGSIAVLPFVNMSNDPDNEYFSDGITEELINALTRATGLYVISRTSSFTLKGKNIDVKEIGKLLNVSKVLEGSVRKAGNKVRITAQLTDTSSGYHLWSETYNREMNDIFELQDEISEAILKKFDEEDADIHVTKPLVESGTENHEAYNLYLKARYENERSGWPRINVIKTLEDIIVMDPNFAKAYALLSTCYTTAAINGDIKSDIASVKAKEYAQKALELDDSLVEGYIAMVSIKRDYEHDWEGALEECRKMLEINTGIASLHSTYAFTLIFTGQYSEAIKEMKLALEMDPLSIYRFRNLGIAYNFSGNHEEACKIHIESLTIDPGNVDTYRDIGFSYTEMGDAANAVANFLKARELLGQPDAYAGQIMYANARGGNTIDVNEYIKKMEAEKEVVNERSILLTLASLYGAMKNFDKMFSVLNEALDSNLDIIYFMHIPYYRKSVGNDPRYLALKKRLNLDKYEFEEI